MKRKKRKKEEKTSGINRSAKLKSVIDKRRANKVYIFSVKEPKSLLPK